MGVLSESKSQPFLQWCSSFRRYTKQPFHPLNSPAGSLHAARWRGAQTLRPQILPPAPSCPGHRSHPCWIHTRIQSPIPWIEEAPVPPESAPPMGSSHCWESPGFPARVWRSENTPVELRCRSAPKQWRLCSQCLESRAPAEQRAKQDLRSGIDFLMELKMKKGWGVCTACRGVWHETLSPEDCPGIPLRKSKDEIRRS